MSRYGEYRRPILMFEAYKDWLDDPRRLEEADAKHDFPSFLYGPVRQSMWHGYSRVQPQYRKYARVEPMTDFRERRLRGLNGLLGIGFVGDHGEYPQLRRSERPSPPLVIDTYGGVYSITRQAIINDDTGELLNRNPADMGYAAALFVTETVIALIESNPTAADGTAMYHSSRSNEVVAELSEDSLATLISNMENQRDDDNRHIVITPKTLVVKTARKQWIANRILSSPQASGSVSYGTTATDSGTRTLPTPANWTGTFDKGTINPLAGILSDVVRDPYYTDPDDYYLFADPQDVPSFAVGFLNGKEEPFIGLKDPQVRAAMGGGTDPYDFDFDCVDFKVRLDFGVGSIDPHGTARGKPS